MKRTGPDAESERTRDVRNASVYVKNSGNSTSRENENATSGMNVDDEKNARDIGIGREIGNATAVGLGTGIGIGAGRGVGAEITGTGTVKGTANMIVIVDVTVHYIAQSVPHRLVLVTRSQNNPKHPRARHLHPRNHPWMRNLSKRLH